MKNHNELFLIKAKECQSHLKEATYEYDKMWNAITLQCGPHALELRGTFFALSVEEYGFSVVGATREDIAERDAFLNNVIASLPLPHWQSMITSALQRKETRLFASDDETSVLLVCEFPCRCSPGCDIYHSWRLVYDAAHKKFILCVFQFIKAWKRHHKTKVFLSEEQARGLCDMAKEVMANRTQEAADRELELKQQLEGKWKTLDLQEGTAYTSSEEEDDDDDDDYDDEEIFSD